MYYILAQRFCQALKQTTAVQWGKYPFLNCATMKPWFPRWKLETPCLLVETDQGLVLVDTGLGLYDYERPSGIVRFFRSDFGIIRVKRRDTKISPHV
jgi:hypothetical protein